MAHLQQFIGTISTIEPSRAFTDGILYHRIQFTNTAGEIQAVEKIFATNKMTAVLKRANHGRFFLWNSHLYAFRSDSDTIEDIKGARRSYFKRDARLLILLSVSMILLPFTLFVLMKKFARAGSWQAMESFFLANKNAHA